MDKTLSDNLFYEYYKSVFPDGPEAMLRAFAQNSSWRTLKKKEILVHKGQCSVNVYFHFDGVLQSFDYKSNNQVLTDSFCYKRGEMMVLTSVLQKIEPSEAFVQAITHCKLVSISIKDFVEIMNRFPYLKLYYIQWMSEKIRQHLELMRVRTMQGKDRCSWFDENYKEVEEKIQKSYIASFLDMTIYSYSRNMSDLMKL